jgi:hypothetical protein
MRFSESQWHDPTHSFRQSHATVRQPRQSVVPEDSICAFDTSCSSAVGRGRAPRLPQPVPGTPPSRHRRVAVGEMPAFFSADGGGQRSHPQASQICDGQEPRRRLPLRGLVDAP